MNMLFAALSLVGGLLILSSLFIGIFLPYEKRARVGSFLFLVGAVFDIVGFWWLFKLDSGFLYFMLPLVFIAIFIMLLSDGVWRRFLTWFLTKRRRKS